MLLADQVYMIHEHFYGGTLIEFKKDLYMIIGLYKMIWIFFNVIPYWVVRGMDKEGWFKSQSISCLIRRLHSA